MTERITLVLDRDLLAKWKQLFTPNWSTLSPEYLLAEVLEGIMNNQIVVEEAAERARLSRLKREITREKGT